MSSGSTDQQIPPQVEESTVFKQEGEEGDAKIRVAIAQERVEELEECKTPTLSGNKIPIIQKCPPAPRKKRRPIMLPFSSRMKRSSSRRLSYVVSHQEVESFFESIFDLTRVNKRCRSV